MSTLRKFATPLTIATFTIVGVTGVLWYFHFITSAGRWLHEIIGLAMMVVIVLHVVLNWRAFKTYFKRPLAIAIIVLGVVLTVGAYLVPDQTPARGGPPQFAAFSKFADEDLTTLGPIFDTTAEDLVTRLLAAGYSGAKVDKTIEDLVGTNVRAQMQAFSALAADGSGLGGQGQGAALRN
ncbi:DUF4405 domain-containing protein [Celeribacter neptunius]|uniref:Flavinylation-associated cytochrome domain-containing protein n=1 Tax=Celeribacter neptunius TaxID=588602 RepID=A0A1I3VJS1_9RHOB|nr:DUF4405 domain-containing protein [Celeribacter neptunius]SFJ94381.1 protein of unknown function [Celeribacter neptunius]